MYLSSLPLSLVALLFVMFATLCLVSVFFRVCYVGLVSSMSYGFSMVGFHSASLRLFLFFSCFPWYRCAELVFWNFGPFNSELCGSSLAWTLCMYLFSLWGASYFIAGGCASYFIAGGCASGALGMCLPTSWWFWSSSDYSSSDPHFLLFCVGAWSSSFGFGGLLCLRFYLFTFFVFAKTFYGKKR